MVKFVVFCTKVIAATIAAVLFSSCHVKDIHFGEGIDGNGNVTRQTRDVGNNFSKIDVNRGLNVTLEQSDTDENIDEAKAKNIRVKMPAVTEIETSSGSSVTTSGVFKGTGIVVKTSSGSESNVNLEFDKIRCESSSGSSITLKGKALDLSTDSSSGSNIDAKELIVNNVVSESTSGSSTDVHPMVSLNGKASSGSSISYDSSPKTIVKEESSGGSVSKD